MTHTFELNAMSMQKSLRRLIVRAPAFTTPFVLNATLLIVIFSSWKPGPILLPYMAWPGSFFHSFHVRATLGVAFAFPISRRDADGVDERVSE